MDCLQRRSEISERLVCAAGRSSSWGSIVEAMRRPPAWVEQHSNRDLSQLRRYYHNFKYFPSSLLWRQSPEWGFKTIVIGGWSSVQWAVLPWCLLCSCSPFYPLLFCFFLFFFYPVASWASFFLLSVFNVLSLHLRLLQRQSIPFCVALISLPPSLNLLFFDPLFTLPSLRLFFFPRRLRWESIFCHVVGGGPRRLDPPDVWLPETPEDGEHLAAEWVGGGESCRNHKGLG